MSEDEELTSPSVDDTVVYRLRFRRKKTKPVPIPDDEYVRAVSKNSAEVVARKLTSGKVAGMLVSTIKGVEPESRVGALHIIRLRTRVPTDRIERELYDLCLEEIHVGLL